MTIRSRHAFTIDTTLRQPTIQNQPGLDRDIMVSVVSRKAQTPLFSDREGEQLIQLLATPF
jgi:hypothetical protein